MGAADGGQEEQGKQKKPEPNGVLKRDIKWINFKITR